MNIKTEVKNEFELKYKIDALEQQLMEGNNNPEKQLRKLAEFLFLDGNYLRALSCYLKLLSFNPTNARIWNKLAVIFLKLGEKQAAIDMSRIAFRLINRQLEE
ncbi:MAG: tetratricopeptide repeat protein [Asgard group archaeon]|nr:tetratricopeptide repeat protein [Asgard group archaeon]